MPATTFSSPSQDGPPAASTVQDPRTFLEDADLTRNEQEPECGERYPDMRRVYATLTFAKQAGQCYSVNRPDGRTTVVCSLEAFERVACAVLTYRLAMVEQENDKQALGADMTTFTDEICQVVDQVVPEPEDVTGLLVFAAWNPAFFATVPSYYDVDNGLSPARIVYENVYQQTRQLFEDQWAEIVEQAKLLARQWTIRRNEVHALERLRERLRQNMAVSNDDDGILTRLITDEQKRLKGLPRLQGSGQ